MTKCLSLNRQPLQLVGLLLCSQLITVLAFAQVHISVSVTGTGNEALAAISVTVKNTNAGAATDASGNYTINAAIKPGIYILVFSGVGYKTAEKPLQVTNAGN